MIRPTSMFYQGAEQGQDGCTAASCGAEIIGLANPFIWWAATAAAIYLVYRLIRYREWTTGFVLMGLAAGYLPWLLYLNRTVFQFYSIAFEPYLILALTLAIGVIIGSPTDPRWRRTGSLRLVGLCFAIMVAASVFFWPIWTGMQLDFQYLAHPLVAPNLELSNQTIPQLESGDPGLENHTSESAHDTPRRNPPSPAFPARPDRGGHHRIRDALDSACSGSGWPRTLHRRRPRRRRASRDRHRMAIRRPTGRRRSTSSSTPTPTQIITVLVDGDPYCTVPNTGIGPINTSCTGAANLPLGNHTFQAFSDYAGGPSIPSGGSRHVRHPRCTTTLSVSDRPRSPGSPTHRLHD